MGLFGIWTISFIMSIVFEFKNEFKMFKDFADIGYKINTDGLTDLSRISATSDAIGNSLLAMLIPFYNVACTLKRISQYEQNKELIFDQYVRLGIVEEMSTDEWEEYKKNPTGFNAILVPLKKQVYEENEKISFGTITIEDSNGEVSVINIKLDLNQEDPDKMIEIITMRGPIRDLSKEEQLKFIREHLGKAFEKGVSKFGSKEAFIEKLCKEDTVDVSDIDKLTVTSEKIEDEEEIKPLSRLERYKQLKQSILENGFLYGEDMVLYKELKEKYEDEQNLTLK